MLKIGDAAPLFEAKDETGARIRLSDFRGRKVVLYFYPMDSTPGCTAEACSFRDTHSRFVERNTTVLGVSGDGERSHRRFKARHGLPFPLLSDPGRKIARAYGALGERRLLGIRFAWPRRATFVIDEKGVIEAAHHSVRVAGHASAILDELGESAQRLRLE